MRILWRLCIILLSAGLALSQSTPSGTAAPASPVSDEIKALREAIAEQQKQIAVQQQQIEKLEKQVTRTQSVSAKGADVSPRLVNANLNAGAGINPATQPASDAPVQEKPKESPLSFRIGGADFTPGGFVDFENVFRSTNTGNVAGTNFWAIPFSNTVNGHNTEFRSTGQYSRFNLKVNEKFGGNDVTGFIEFDFNGNDAGNVFVTSNSHTDRLRLFWLDLKRGKWEFTGGQVWGLMTANRVGVSPVSGDVFTTYNEDGNHQVGNNFTRAAQFRAAYHFNKNWAWAAGIENPQQYVGPFAQSVVFPNAFNAQVGGQFDAANNAGTPNVSPDVVSKLAYDNDFAGKHFHAEVGGLFTAVKITNLPALLPGQNSTFTHHSAVGGGIEGGLAYEFVKNYRLVANGIWGPGVGRYVLGMGPQAVVVPVSTNGGTCGLVAGQATNCDLAISMVHAGNALAGFEAQVTPKTLLAAYYGGAYFQRNAFNDPTAKTQPTIIGFGGNNEAGASFQNRAIQEATIDWVQTFWKNPQYGALLLVTQASYVTRSPWFVPAGAPKNAHLGMGYVSLKYVLP
jgi:hypothetical protein